MLGSSKRQGTWPGSLITARGETAWHTVEAQQTSSEWKRKALPSTEGARAGHEESCVSHCLGQVGMCSGDGSVEKGGWEGALGMLTR